MSRSTVANLVARLDADTARFQRQMKGAHQTTQRYQKNSKAANDGSIRMANGFQRAANAASVLQGPLNGISGRLSFIASGMRAVGPAGLAFGVGIAAMTMGSAQAIRAGDDFAKSQARLEAQIHATRQSVGLSTNELIRQSEQVARTTLASSADVRKAQGQLLRFTSVTGDEFSRTIKLAQDYAAVTGGDVSSAAERLGRILEEPREGFSRLRREGIHVTRSQQEVVTALMETGQTAKAQAEILSALEERLGGAGSAENIGVSGAADSLGQTWNQMLREIEETTSVGAAAAGALERLDIVMTKIRNSAAGDSGMMKYMDEGELFQARFDADAAIQEIERERAETTRKIEELLDGRSSDELFSLGPTKFRVDKLQGDSMLLRQQQEEQIQMSQMYNDEIARREAEADEARAAAAEAAEERRRAQEADAAVQRDEERKKELDRRQTQSLSAITAMELQYAEEDEKREIAHARQIAQIETLYADREALERMGFETLGQLRAHYVELEREAHEQRNRELVEEEEEKRRIEQEAANSRIETIERQLATEKELLALRRDDRIAELEGMHELELIETERFLELKEALHADHDERLKQMQAMQLSATLGNYSDLFESAAGLAETFAGKQSGLYRTMFAASKAFAVADSTVQIINGIAKAANLPFPANLGAIAATSSATVGLVSSIQGTQLSGARANGGPISQGHWLVGERGPEVLSMGGGTGQITSNENLRAALGNGGSGRESFDLNFNFTGIDNENLVEMLMSNRGAISDMVMMALADQGISL